MSNKNPYEVRLETLKMAKEMLDQAYSTQLSIAYTAAEQFKNSLGDYEQMMSEYTPKMYQPSEVINKAKELYEFITDNK